LCTRMLCTADVSAATTAKSRPTTPMTHSIASACRRLAWGGRSWGSRAGWGIRGRVSRADGEREVIWAGRQDGEVEFGFGSKKERSEKQRDEDSGPCWAVLWY
jgi:hypothetical protein